VCNRKAFCQTQVAWRKWNETIYPLVMTNSLPWKDPQFLIGKPSISMGHLYHGYVSHNQMVVGMNLSRAGWKSNYLGCITLTTLQLTKWRLQALGLLVVTLRHCATWAVVSQQPRFASYLATKAAGKGTWHKNVTEWCDTYSISPWNCQNMVTQILVQHVTDTSWPRLPTWIILTLEVVWSCLIQHL
jgi:hypothetical protein